MALFASRMPLSRVSRWLSALAYIHTYSAVQREGKGKGRGRGGEGEEEGRRRGGGGAQCHPREADRQNINNFTHQQTFTYVSYIRR